MSDFYILFESAAGLCIFDCRKLNDVVVADQGLSNFGAFARLVRLNSFLPFPSLETALDTMNQITEGMISDFLNTFLSTMLPNLSKSSSHFVLGVSEPKLAGLIGNDFSVECISDNLVRESIRYIRMHFNNFMDNISPDDIKQAQLGLSHAYSRAKVKFNVHGEDNMIISASDLLQLIDKDLNLFTMRLREWYSVHFPELSKIIQDNLIYSKLVQTIRFREQFNYDEVLKILDDEDLAESIKDAAENTIGRKVLEQDMETMCLLAGRVQGMLEYREKLLIYLKSRMTSVAPNLTALIGEKLGARLISSTGSLVSLAKQPASTIQLLGAEKALFSAKKRKEKTPKYGMIYGTSVIGNASPREKGQVARSLSAKIAIASRIDAFSEEELRSGQLGTLMKDMIEKRRALLNVGEKPEPNLAEMEKAVSETREFEKEHPVE